MISVGDTKLYKSLGSLIKNYRQSHKLSQEIFAASIRISARELRNWEEDRHTARIDNLHDLSEITGIPMQVCVALNADQPVWYSLRSRLFAYSSVELTQFEGKEIYRYHKQSDTEIFISTVPITTERHINKILSYHQNVYGMEKPLGKDIINKAGAILPDLNRIALDCWGHHIGHLVCLPIKKDVYEWIKKESRFERYLTTERISDIVAFHEGVFFTYSIFAASVSVAHRLIMDGGRGFVKIGQKERYLNACYAATREVKEICKGLGMRQVFRNITNYEHRDAKNIPSIYELELDMQVRRYKHYGVLTWMNREHDRKTETENLIGEDKREGFEAIPVQETRQLQLPVQRIFSMERKNYDVLTVDNNSDVLTVDEGHHFSPDVKKQDYQKKRKTRISKQKLKMEACPNLKCTLYSKKEKANIISNGTYRSKDGTLFYRFLCKECGGSFCSRAGSIFYGLRSPEEKVLTALKLLAKGLPLRQVAETLEVEFRTVRHWLKVVAQQNEKMDAMLMQEPDVSQEELDVLRTFVKNKSLRQRAILWRRRSKSVASGP